MTTTTNLGLKKPETTDYRDIADLNYNMDILDGVVLQKNQGAANAGKFMIVGSNGEITPVEVPFANGGTY